MTEDHWRLMWAFLLALSFCISATPSSAAPRLLVVVSVDQLRADSLDRYASEYTKGFKRLLEQGAILTDTHHTHIPTETGPGHSVIMTGQLPNRTGIVGNEWWDRLLSAPAYCVSDLEHGLSPKNLLVDTLGDTLKTQDARSMVVSLSFKDRAAILMGGKKADAAIWYDKNKGEFTTSSYYRRPGWLNSLNWRLKKKGGDLTENTTTYFSKVRYTPQADRILLSLAEESLHRFRLGRDAHPDILAVGFSGTDYIGHKYGPNSPEMRTQLLSMDALLEELMNEVTEAAGKEWDMVLTSDHGAPSAPESPEGKTLGFRRISYSDFDSAIKAALKRSFPAQEPWMLSDNFPHLYLNRDLAHRRGLEWRTFLSSAAHALSTIDGIATVYVADAIDPADAFAEAYRNNIMPDRSGDLLVRLLSGTFISDQTDGVDHGSPYSYDTHVPLIFMGPDFIAGRYAEPAAVVDLAATAAAVLDVPFHPEGSRIHTELLRFKK